MITNKKFTMYFSGDDTGDLGALEMTATATATARDTPQSSQRVAFHRFRCTGSAQGGGDDEEVKV